MGLGEIGLQRDGAAIACNRLVNPALLLQHVAQAVMVRRQPIVNGDGLADALQRHIQIAAPGRNQP